MCCRGKGEPVVVVDANVVVEVVENRKAGEDGCMRRAVAELVIRW